jgi:hypothetical protein
MRNVTAAFVLAICLLLASAALAPAHAFGAIALGVTAKGVAEDGFAYGAGWNYPTQSGANQYALKQCRDQTDIPEAVKACKIVDTFRNQCTAMARDPQSGSSGLGLAIANDKSAAEARALADCQASDGDRGKFCKVDVSECDGK